MQSERHPAHPPSWRVGASSNISNGSSNNGRKTPTSTRTPIDDDPTPIMSATAGPVDPNDFYWPGKHGSPGESPLEEFAKPLPDLSELGKAMQSADRESTPKPDTSSPFSSPSPYTHTRLRSASQSPAPSSFRNASPATSAAQNSFQQHQRTQSPGLNSMRSTPVLLPSRPAGTVRNIANKFNQSGSDAERTSQERYRRPIGGKKSRSPIRKSPTREVGAKLHKRRSPVKPTVSTYDGIASSFPSSAASAQPKPVPSSHVKPPSYMTSRPLFGEITSDGRWHGNFDLDLDGPLILNNHKDNHDQAGNAPGLHRGRSRSQQNLSNRNSLLPPEPGHRRSRSDMDAWGQPAPPNNYFPTFTSEDLPIMHPPAPVPQPSQPISRPKTPTTSRIPVSTNRRSVPPSPRSSSVASVASQQSNRSRLSKSPTRLTTGVGKENTSPSTPPSSRSRYHRTPTSPRTTHTLSAQIVAPAPKTSPQLRSSRPRQPVSSATTAASRARAADRLFEPSSTSPPTSSTSSNPPARAQNKDTRRPSEQWLGKPYDPQQERSRRRIPPVVDFAEKRARIQKAITQHLEESRSYESLRSRSQSQSRSRQASDRNLRAKAEAANAATEVDEGGTAASQGPGDGSGDVESERIPPPMPQHQGEIVEQTARVPDSVPMPGTWPETPGLGAKQRGLSLDTGNVSTATSEISAVQGGGAEEEPMTAHTEFEDESPVLGRASEELARPGEEDYDDQQQRSATPKALGSSPVLLSAATYQPPSSFSSSTAKAPKQSLSSRPLHQGPSAAKLAPVPFSPVTEAEGEDEEARRRSALFGDVMQSWQQQQQQHQSTADGEEEETSGRTDPTPETPTGADDDVVTDGPSDGHGLERGMGEKGSIRIMFEDSFQDGRPAMPFGHGVARHTSNIGLASSTNDTVSRRREPPFNADDPFGIRRGLSSDKSGSHDQIENGFLELPSTDGSRDIDEEALVTPRKLPGSHDQSHMPMEYLPSPSDSVSANGSDPSTVSRILSEYRSTGSLSADMYKQMQRQMVDLQRASVNGDSNGIMIQSLLDSIMQQVGAANSSNDDDTRTERDDEGRGEARSPDTEVGTYAAYGLPPVTPDTPPGWRTGEESGTATVFHSDPSYSLPPPMGDEEEEEPEDDEQDFAASIRKADEAWERQQRGLGLSNIEDRPPPPPKDLRYSSRSSVSLADMRSADLSDGLRISGTGSFDTPPSLDSTSAHASSAFEGGHKRDSRLRASLSTPALVEPNPPPPAHAPPLPPPASSPPSTAPPPPLSEKPPQIPASLLDAASTDPSANRPRTAYATSSSSRPSVDSQRQPAPLPSSVSASTLGESTRQTSLDAAGDVQGKLAASPEQKRLLKRRHIIRELLDTENTYHQDLKIIEDIYRATATPDLVSTEDKKILFGNCDDIERFSLHFYDELRKAAASVYVPAKATRWLNTKRGSFSTTQSDGAGQPSASSPEPPDDEKDRATTIGQAFLQNLPRMEQVYSVYLRNHEAANRRLVALRNDSTVKCWLAECHNNASDITTAWDLDSLLVKPTQRVAKYPMLLQQLLESTTANHPDREALSSGVKDSIAMLTRINEAKKRADLVDQIVNRKGKDTDVRSGIAKAFGRRTEKLKERVGMAEAFQDPEFDELAHKFGGHFIRLQICMRDVQDYMNRIDKAVDQINNYASALDNFTDMATNTLTEVQSKWRKYGQVIREITAVAFAEHRGAIAKRVIGPMIACIKLHDGPQSAISKRKKRIIDYAKCKSIEKRGEKPDKRTVEAAEMYEALNEQLKLDLPKLYSLTANLVQNCLNCFLSIQLVWYNTWERKLRPILETAEVPNSIADIEVVFRPDFDLVKNGMAELGICNGAVLAEAGGASFMSPSTTHVGESEPSSAKASFSLEGSRRTYSIGSDQSAVPGPGSYGYNRRSSNGQSGDGAVDTRMRSTSSLSVNRGPPTTPGQQTPGGGMLSNRPWSNGPPQQSHSYTAGTPSRPDTATTTTPTPYTHNSYSGYASPRRSVDQHSRPASGSTYFTAQPSSSSSLTAGLLPSTSSQPDFRFSGIFSSAMPPSETSLMPNSSNSNNSNSHLASPRQSGESLTPAGTPRAAAPPPPPSVATGSSRPTSRSRPQSSSGGGSHQQAPRAPDDMRVLFVCASLFEFSIDKTRREAGYPYLTYVQGEVFDVVAQKGELWLAKNQDDGGNSLGWIWEQHFVILSQD